MGHFLLGLQHRNAGIQPLYFKGSFMQVIQHLADLRAARLEYCPVHLGVQSGFAHPREVDV